MIFQQAKTALVNLLANQANGAFYVIGTASQGVTADDVANLPLVTVFYDGGTFEAASGRTHGSVNHDATYRIGLTIASPSGADLATLDNPGSTSDQIQAALANASLATDNADAQFDALVSLVWNILRNPENIFLGLDVGSVSKNWIHEIKKAAPVEKGEWVVISGTINLTLRMAETPSGETGLPGKGIDNSFQVTGDPTANPLDLTQKFDTAVQGQKVGT